MRKAEPSIRLIIISLAHHVGYREGVLTGPGSGLFAILIRNIGRASYV